MLSLEENFPVPTIRREVNWRPAICKGESVIAGEGYLPFPFQARGNEEKGRSCRGMDERLRLGMKG